MSNSGSTTTAAAIMTQQHQSQVNAVQSNGSGPKKVCSGSNSGGGGGGGGMSGGSSSSGVPTPAATPVQNGTSGCASAHPSPPPFPKFGTVIPNRIFVGGISTNTTEAELLELFSVFGHVKAAKIIVDRAGVSKGYGFITFETENDTNQALAHNNVVLRERRLNIARAVKKQPFSRPTVTAIPFDAHLPCGIDGRSSAPISHHHHPGGGAGGGSGGGIPQHLPFYVAPPHHFFNPPYYTSAPLVGAGSAAAAQPTVSQANHQQDQQHTQSTTIYQGPPMFPAQTGPPQPSAAYASMMFQPMYIAQQYPTMVPCEYPYGVNANVTTSNGAPHYIIGGPPSGDSTNSNNHRVGGGGGGGGGGGPPTCYIPSVPPPDGVMYGPGPPPPPPHHPTAFFHSANLEPISLGGPLYTSATGADGSFEPIALHGPVNHYGGGLMQTFGFCEDGTFMDHPSASATPRSVLTSTPPLPPPPPPPPSQLSIEQHSVQRTTATPVVSILSLEQQQEKDPAAMQGGRRPQPLSLSQSSSSSSSVAINTVPVALAQPSRQFRGSSASNGGGNRRGGGGGGGGNGMGRQPLAPPHGAVAPNLHQNSQIQHSTGSYILANRRQRKPQRRMPLAAQQLPQTAATSNPNSCSEMGAGDAPITGNSKDEGLTEQMKSLNVNN